MTKDISLGSLQTLLENSLIAIHRLRFIDILCVIGAFYTVLSLVQVIRRRLKTTALRGPPNPSFLWGVAKVLQTSPDIGAQFEKWAEEYGGVYEIPVLLEGRRIILCDPKAIAHLFGGEPWTYILTPSSKIGIEKIIGEGLMSAIGENHRRLRRNLASAFSNDAIRNLSSVFYDSAYKTQDAWDNMIEANDGNNAVIEVQSWMNHISLDTIGKAGLSHDFGSLDGNPSPVTEVFDALGANGGEAVKTILLLSESFPWLLGLPTPYSKLLVKLNDTMGMLSDALLTRSKKEKEAGTLGETENKSILGFLIKGESEGNQLHLTREEVVGQAKLLLLAGYETISISLTWALIELAKNQDIQGKLRAELLAFGGEPTYDRLANSLPYLDAVVHETLRMYPPVPDFHRMATKDDVIPLSKPVRTRSGKLVDHITVGKGTYICVPALSVNRSAALWGTDAKEYRPERWIEKEGIPPGAKEIQGHRHLLTFMDGPRTCLGKGFAVAEFKIILSVLVKHFVFEFRDGPETKIEMSTGVLPRPKVAGEEGSYVPLRVRRFSSEMWGP